MPVVDCRNLWPKPEHALNWWGHIAGALGSNAPLARPFLIGLRGVKIFAAETHQPVHRPNYDDTFVLLRAGEQPYPFAGSTTAYQLKSKASPDTDGDGLGDVGSIRCGRYVLHYIPGQALGPIFHLKMPDGSDRIPAHRDFDHDGVISEAEAKRSELLRGRPQTNSDGCYATAVLFHPGFTSGRSSIACQTASQPNLDELKRAGPVIDYVLANAWDVLPFAEEARELYHEEDTVPDVKRV